MTAETLLTGFVLIDAGRCWLVFNDGGTTHRIGTNLPPSYLEDAKRWLRQIQVAATQMRATPWKAVVA